MLFELAAPEDQADFGPDIPSSPFIPITLQVDCPDLAMGRHVQFTHPSTEEFRKRIGMNIAALNHAVANIPAERLRMHLCWSNGPGPHHCDVALDEIADIVWEAKPQTVLMPSSPRWRKVRRSPEPGISDKPQLAAHTQARLTGTAMDAQTRPMTVLALAVENGTVTEIGPADVSGLAGAGFVWLHAEGVGHGESMDVPDYVPAMAANALVASETRPRCDEVDDAVLINLRGTAADTMQDSDGLVSIRVWVEARRVTSVSRHRLAALGKVETAVRAGRITDGGDFVSVLAQAMSVQLDPQVADLGDELDDCEGMLDGGNIYELRRKIAWIRSQAIVLRRFVAPDRDALGQMAQLEFDWISKEDRLHLREAADRFARMAEELEAVRERAALLHEQLTDLRAEMIDQRSLAIAVTAFIFLPLTFVTGLLGMNVAGIPFADHPMAFWGVVAFCTVIGASVMAWFAKAHWLDD